MTVPDTRLATALARLESRWGSAAVRLGSGSKVRTEGALAPALEEPEPAPPSPARHPLERVEDGVISTGFPALDAVLGPGGLPRQASATIRGDTSSGKVTLALRCIAEAQARGSIVAFLDFPRTFDPLEAVARGVDLRWLVVLRPANSAEGFALAGAVVGGRAVDLLVVDLPARLATAHEATVRRLAAHARRVGARLIVLEPARLSGPVHGALAEATSIRLELDRGRWIRLGRDVVGQQTWVTVAKNRFGPPGRRVELEIRYADEGLRQLRKVELPATGPPGPAASRSAAPADPRFRLVPRTLDHATPPPPLASPSAPVGTRAPGNGGGDARHGPRGPRRAAVGRGERP